MKLKLDRANKRRKHICWMLFLFLRLFFSLLSPLRSVYDSYMRKPIIMRKCIVHFLFIVKIPRAMRVVIEVLLIEKQTSFDIMKLAWQLTTKNEGGLSMKDTKSLSHTSYWCKYHIVIVPKYRRMVIYNKLRKDIGQIIRMLCERKPGVMLLEAEACPDHIHMLLEIPPKYSIAEFMGYLKSKSTLMIFERHANMKYKFGNR